MHRAAACEPLAESCANQDSAFFWSRLPSAAGPSARVAAALSHSFDGPDLVWQLVDRPPTAKVLSHGCAGDVVRQGSGSERITVTASGGESLHFVYPIARLAVLDELEVRMWLKSTNPGSKLAARVILPRTIDPKSGAAKSVLVSGAACESPDRWQQLRIADVPQLLAAQVRVLRAARRAMIDPREAYVDAIVLVVPGGPTSTTVWTDALEVDGVVLTNASAKNDNSAVVQTVFSARLGRKLERQPTRQVGRRLLPQTPCSSAGQRSCCRTGRFCRLASSGITNHWPSSRRADLTQFGSTNYRPVNCRPRPPVQTSGSSARRPRRTGSPKPASGNRWIACSPGT